MNTNPDYYNYGAYLDNEISVVVKMDEEG